MFLNCSDGSFDRPTAILSSQDCFEFYNARLLQVARYIDPYKTGDLSFTALEYQGMPWYQDRQCPSGRMYMLNTRHVHFFIDPSMFFEWSEADLARSTPQHLSAHLEAHPRLQVEDVSWCA